MLKSRSPKLYIKFIFIKLKIFCKKFFENLLVVWLRIYPISNKTNPTGNIETIAIPLFAGIGDAVILTTLINRVTKLYPQARIFLIETKRTQDVLRATYPELSFITISKLSELKQYQSKFDLLISPSRNINHYIAAYYSKPHFFVGYNYTLFIRKKESHIIRSDRIMRQLGENGRSDPSIKISQEILGKTSKHLNKIASSKKVRIGLVIGGRWPSKTYPEHLYKELIVNLSSRYDNICFILLGNEYELGERIAQLGNHIYNFSGQYSIQETMGLIQHLDMIISPDGGLLNIAIALKKPLIGLFGSVEPKTIVPESYFDQIIYIKKCPFQPCFNEEHEPMCRMKKPYCIEIPTDIIINKYEKLIAENGLLH